MFTKKEAVDNNLKVLDGLKSVFSMLNEHGAIIGRDGLCIAIDLNKTPDLLADEASDIFQASRLHAPNGVMGVFENFMSDKTAGVLFMNMSHEFIEGESSFCKFHAFDEIKSLLDAIQPMPQCEANRLAELSRNLRESMQAVMFEHRDEIIAGLFGGGNWTNPDDKKKKIN